MSSVWPATFALVAATLLAQPTVAQTGRSDAAPTAVTAPPFGADDLLWMELKAGDVQLTDSMNVYASRSGVFVPLGEFARLLDLAIGVFPAQRRAEGFGLPLLPRWA